jgi:hypothetical protein
LAEYCRHFADNVVESPAERAEAIETNLETNIGYASVCGAQKKHRALDASALQVAVRGLAKRRAERADKVRFRHLRETRESSDTERLSKSAIH